METAPERHAIEPQVDNTREFYEIANDFADPLEAVREAISNAYDWDAKNIWISFESRRIEGARTLVVVFRDDGIGMSKKAITTTFWGLGLSEARDQPNKIGEKGHGSKVFLRSERILVRTHGPDGSFAAQCERPFRKLCNQELHEPYWEETLPPSDGATFTEIELQGYNNNVGERFTQRNVKDYILWFTKAGSVERELTGTTTREFRAHLKGLGTSEFEELPQGHIFPPVADNLDELFEKYSYDAADYFVKRYARSGALPKDPSVRFEAVIYVEGDSAKRAYNPLIKQRLHRGAEGYKVGDRYGVWLCKDYIPVCRVNEWISGFGTGGNAWVILHGFVNCQELSLTANRGTVANTEPTIMEGLKQVLSEMTDVVEKDVLKSQLYALVEMQREARTREQEEAEYRSRVKAIKSRARALLDGGNVLEPSNEAELFGFFMRVYARHPDLFEFEPCDYKTTVGIDMIAKSTSPGSVSEDPYGYVEFKHRLGQRAFNHGFTNLRWIICWDFSPSCVDGYELESSVDSTRRRIIFPSEKGNSSQYYLDSQQARMKIQVVRLKQYLDEKLNLRFSPK